MAFKVDMHRLEQPAAEVVSFQQMAEFTNSRFIGRWFPAEVDINETAHGGGVIQCLLDARIREIKPLLEKIDPKHPLQTHRRTPIAWLRINRLDHTAQIF